MFVWSSDLKILSEWQLKCLIIRPSTFGKEHIVLFSCTSLKHRLTINKLLVKKFGKEKIRCYIERFTYLLRRSEVGKTDFGSGCERKGMGPLMKIFTLRGFLCMQNLGIWNYISILMHPNKNCNLPLRKSLESCCSIIAYFLKRVQQ